MITVTAQLYCNLQQPMGAQQNARNFHMITIPLTMFSILEAGNSDSFNGAEVLKEYLIEFQDIREELTQVVDKKIIKIWFRPRP